uniref:Secreted protein n=1 Tax=Pyxicephalus adspersus TaxID=30357 RepID=A0AAV3ARF6_PYXAD|nr:TPA: hypothetical protein GDO54_011218 [Pyxicephalus adspersus]
MSHPPPPLFLQVISSLICLEFSRPFYYSSISGKININIVHTTVYNKSERKNPTFFDCYFDSHAVCRQQTKYQIPVWSVYLQLIYFTH